LGLGIVLYFFAARMFKEVIEKEDEDAEFQEKAYKYGYITNVSLESGLKSPSLSMTVLRPFDGSTIPALLDISKVEENSKLDKI
jgi:hypothetical protein